MRISYNWLQDYFADKLPSPEELKEKLSLHAFEIESLEKKGKDYILEADILPNRAHDSLGYIGLAREAGLLFEKKLKLPEYKYEKNSEKSSDYISLDVRTSLVRRAMKRVVLNVSVRESPEWLKERLFSIGQRAINNVVDITNFVMWETGQPVHAFDFDKITRGQIIIREVSDAEKITTLDGEEYVLKKGMLVISDPQKALDIAGIKGGASSRIDEKTKNIVLSVCSFEPAGIRKTSAALGLKTDASYRFERDISPEKTKEAMERLSELIAKNASGRVLSETIDVYPEPVPDFEIDIEARNLNKILGTSIADSELEKILSSLKKYSGFDWQRKGNSYSVGIPKERLDLLPSKEKFASGNKEDLVEEIGRIYGFYKIKSEEPKNFNFKPKVNTEVAFTESLKDFLVSRGFSEVMTYSFTERGQIELKNPLSSDKKYLRASLFDGLLKSLELNKRNAPLFGLDDIKIFEIGKIFGEDSEDLSLGLAVSLKNGKENKKYLQEILDELNLKGEIKDNVALAGIGKMNAPSYEGLEFDIGGNNKFKCISQYPFVLRDISLWTPSLVSSSEVRKLIEDKAGELLADIRLFDEYKKDGRVSYAFKLVFQSKEKTLSDEEAGKIMTEIEEKLTENKGWEVR